MRETILEHLRSASTSIVIAVSWLTDVEILEVLMLKAKNEVKVSILLSASEWNYIRLNQFKELSTHGAIVRKRGQVSAGMGKFMHCKFAVIDDRTVLHGSYNWTKLANSNDENLDVVEDDGKVAAYLTRFKNMFAESEDFFANLESIDLEKIEELYGEESDLNHSEVNANEFGELTKKTDKVMEQNKQIYTKLAEIDELSYDDLNNAKFIGKLLVYSYEFEDSNHSLLEVNLGTSRVKISIRNLLLIEGITNSSEDFRLVQWRLGKFPSVLLTFLLRNCSVDLRCGFEIDARNRYRIRKPIDGDFFLSFSTNTSAWMLNEKVIVGRKLMKSIIDGEKLESELRKEFARLTWLQ